MTMQYDETTRHDDEKSTHNVHLLTADDVEEIIVMIDSLYWAFHQLTQRRTLRLKFDPHELSKSMQEPRHGK